MLRLAAPAPPARGKMDRSPEAFDATASSSPARAGNMLRPAGKGPRLIDSSQLLRHQVGHGTGDRAEVEDAAGVLLELDAPGVGMGDGALKGFDGSVEVMTGHLESGLLGLADLLGDAVVLGFESGVVAGRGADAGGVLLVLAAVGSDIGQDTQLGDVGVLFGAESLEFRMEGGIAGAGQAGIALVDLDVGISLVEVDRAGKGFVFDLHILDMLYNDAAMRRAAVYVRVSTVDQNLETQLLDLRQMASQRGLEIVQEYSDRISGTKARRPGLDALMAEARRGKFDVVLVWASDRIARSTRHFLELLDEFNRLGIEYASFREQIDTGGPLGRAIVIIIGAVAELERNLIIERVKAGMRRARLEGQRLGRRPLDLDREAIYRDRRHGMSLGQIAHAHRISRTTVHRILSEKIPVQSAVPKGVAQPAA